MNANDLMKAIAEYVEAEVEYQLALHESAIHDLSSSGAELEDRNAALANLETVVNAVLPAEAKEASA